MSVVPGNDCFVLDCVPTSFLAYGVKDKAKAKLVAELLQGAATHADASLPATAVSDPFSTSRAMHDGSQNDLGPT
jgi:hypothetical protein